MHGRKKETITEAQSRIQADKASAYSSLVDIISERRRKKNFSPETLALTAKLLKNNPDYLSLWNFRREILLEMYGSSINLSKDKPDTMVPFEHSVGSSVRDTELRLSADGIVKNSKSYGAWHHRQWIVDRFVVDRESELALCKEFLKLDQRNFHCWNYRRFVAAATASPPLEESHTTEFEFSFEKINENFSNYSAFHHRSVYIQKLYSPNVKDILDSEFSIVESAIFTEPDDQSAWWYHQFLISWTSKQLIDEDPGDMEWFLDVLRAQTDLVKSLLEIETNSKWPLTCLVNLLGFIQKLTTDTSAASRIHDERLQLLQKLIEIDPTHRNRYIYLGTEH